MIEKKYPAKLILFGEYTVILGSKALAIPFPHFQGTWKSSSDAIDARLIALATYISQHQKLSKLFDINKLKQEAKKGLRFDSTIPLGYGLGSSGALCAALYDRFSMEKEENLERLKVIFAQLESHFHGSSSGVDPLICYLQKTVLLEDGNVKLLDQIHLPKAQLFLLDIGFGRKTGNLVNWFMEQCRQESYIRQLESRLIPEVENCIAALRQPNFPNLLAFVHEISHFEWQYFQPMIPNEIQNFWLEGLSSDWFKLKLCGAGGGGFFLGITNDLERLEQYSNFDILPISTTLDH